MPSLLLLDDDLVVCNAVTRLLVHEGVGVEGCTSPAAFLALARTGGHRALLAGLSARVCQGTHVCEELRRGGDRRPIGLMSANLTAENGLRLALEAGADAFIDKTLDVEPFVAAVRGLLVTPFAAPEPSGITQPVRSSGTAPHVQRPGYTTTIELRGDLVLVHDHLIELRPKEHAVLRCLIENAGSIVSSDALAREVWGLAMTPATSLIRTTVARLRERLGSAASLVESVADGYMIRRGTRWRV